MSDDTEDEGYELTSWELAAHVVGHEDNQLVDKQAIGILLGTLRRWWDDDEVDEELIEELLMELITSYVRSHFNYFTPTGAGEGNPVQSEEEAVKEMRKNFGMEADDEV